MLRSLLRDRITADGPIPFEEFMAACLYHPDGGFFTTGPLRSERAGDFLTSPEVSVWFGRLLARFADGLPWRVSRAVVVDVGAGSGSLLAAMIDELGDRFDFHAVEVSPAARSRLSELLGEGRVHPSLDGVATPIHGLIVANELLDNLPVALAVRRGSSWEERWVGNGNDGFELVAVPARGEVAAWCEAYAGPVSEGGMVEAQLAASQWVSESVGRLAEGALVAIDYGGTAQELAPRRTQGTLRTYRAHHLGPDPLLEPGATDITVDVDFTAMTAAAQAAGAEVEVHRQDEFLESLGLRQEIARLRAEERAEAADGDPMRRLHLRSERVDAETLLHPRGLGDFRAMVARK